MNPQSLPQYTASLKDPLSLHLTSIISHLLSLFSPNQHLLSKFVSLLLAPSTFYLLTPNIIQSFSISCQTFLNIHKNIFGKYFLRIISFNLHTELEIQLLISSVLQLKKRELQKIYCVLRLQISICDDRTQTKDCLASRAYCVCEAIYKKAKPAI